MLLEQIRFEWHNRASGKSDHWILVEMLNIECDKFSVRYKLNEDGK